LTKSIIKRSVVISGHATSVSLEPEFWEVLQEIAVAEDISVAALIRQIDEALMKSKRHNLSSAIRIFILKKLQDQIKKIP
jgi:predicted DNA-binding ribbon-helix-helix protein